MDIQLGSLEEVNAREIWMREATDFTPWLHKNIDRLSEVLEIDIEISESEAPVGSFAADLVGLDLGSKRLVVIENQLGQTDHSHLGQVLTYAAGREADIVVWIALEFREEHRQALLWLNERTHEDQVFFGIELRVVRIGSSSPAPLFRIVAQPNEWQKTLATRTGESTPRGEAYREFWTEFLAELRNRRPGLTRAKQGQPQNWLNIGAGRTGIRYNVAFTRDRQFKVEVYFDYADAELNRKVFDLLEAEKDNIEREIGKELNWERIDDRVAKRIAVYTDGSIEDSEDDLQALCHWGLTTLEEFVEVFRDRILSLPPNSTLQTRDI